MSFQWGSVPRGLVIYFIFGLCSPQVIVRDAGHILPHDQPARGYDMIQRFVEGRTFA